MATLTQEEQHALIEEHLVFAEKGVMAELRKRGGHGDKDEMLSAAYLGLVRAARSFDPALGCTFKTYAFQKVQGAIWRVFQEEKRANGWAYAASAYDEVGPDHKKHGMVCRMNRGEFPVIQTKDGEMELTQDIALASGEPSPETMLLYKEAVSLDQARVESEKRARLEDALTRATDDRDRFIVRAALDGKTATDVAAELNISRERVRQLAERMDFTFPNKWSRRSIEVDAEVVAEPTIIRSRLALPDARQELKRLMLEVGVGGIISYERLAAAIGCDVHTARGMLTSVRKTLLEEHQLLFGPIPHVGLKRLADSEVLHVGDRSVKSVGRAAERGLRVLGAVRDFEALTNGQKLRHNTMMAQFGVLAHVVSEKVTKRIEAHASQPLAIPEMFEAMKESL